MNNPSVINSDETMNVSLPTESLDKSLDEQIFRQNDANSVVDFTSDVSGISQNPRNSYVKVLLTTSFSGIILSKNMGDFLFILNAIIPNSTIKKRLMISEEDLISAAIDEKFTHIIVISMLYGYPFELYFLNLLKNIKLPVLVHSFNCCGYEDFIKFKKYLPSLIMKKPEQLSNSQEFVVNFFSEIFPTPDRNVNFDSDHNNISIKMCSDDPEIKFKYNASSLCFKLTPYCPDGYEHLFRRFECICD